MSEPVGPDYRSLWLDLLAAESPDALRPRAPLDGDTQCDIAIVGAGFSGLWSAYYLAVAEPSLRIVVAERDIAGSPGRYARRLGIDAVCRATRATNEAVDEIARVPGSGPSGRGRRARGRSWRCESAVEGAVAAGAHKTRAGAADIARTQQLGSDRRSTARRSTNDDRGARRACPPRSRSESAVAAAVAYGQRA